METDGYSLSGSAATIEIDMSSWGAACGDQALSIDGIATCIRVAIVGDYPTENHDGPDRFIAHISEDEKGEKATEDIWYAVTEAKEEGLVITEVVLVVPIPESYGDAAHAPELRNWVQEVVEEYQRLVDIDIDMEPHDINEEWMMRINEDKSIEYGKDD